MIQVSVVVPVVTAVRIAIVGDPGLCCCAPGYVREDSCLGDPGLCCCGPCYIYEDSYR